MVDVEFVPRSQFCGFGFAPYHLFCLAYPSSVFPFCYETEDGWFVYKSREEALAHRAELEKQMK